MTTNFYINGKKYSARFVADTDLGKIYIEKPTKTAILHKKDGNFIITQIASYIMDDALDSEDKNKQSAISLLTFEFERLL